MEFRQILELQKENLPGALTPEQRKREGFVTLRYSLEQLLQMQRLCPQVIALENDFLIGYALCLHPDLKDLVPALQPLFQILEDRAFPPAEYRIMGQICIRKGYRGKGHFSRLYYGLRDQTKPLPLITEISQKNTRSLHAHHKLGFQRLAVRQEGGDPWEVVVWK